jgi:copper(I)-binding protein
MTMVALDRIPLPAGRTVAFEPGGKHLMLSGLTGPLERGSSFALTLTFAHAPAAVVTVPILDNPPG